MNDQGGTREAEVPAPGVVIHAGQVEGLTCGSCLCVAVCPGYTDTEFDSVVGALGLTGRTDYEVYYDCATGKEVFLFDPSRQPCARAWGRGRRHAREV